MKFAWLLNRFLICFVRAAWAKSNWSERASACHADSNNDLANTRKFMQSMKSIATHIYKAQYRVKAAA